MLLESINDPSDLKELSYDQLDQLAGEIRSHIVSAVSKAGGHLGSNLGVVELTLALHRVFESPRDRLLRDTGDRRRLGAGGGPRTGVGTEGPVRSALSSGERWSTTRGAR
jgi:hypothetical protein